jgi:predicted nucleic acid-binding protein
MAAQSPADLFITTITQAEILYGIEIMAEGRRKQRLAEAAEEIFAQEFHGRILAFDQPAARHFARIVAARESLGRPIADLDAMIAAIARAHGATLATRNVKDLEHCGIRLLNPWTDVH